MRVLLLTSHTARPGLARLWPAGTELAVVGPRELSDGAVAAADALVLDGALPSLDQAGAALLRAAVEAGVPLLALGAASAAGGDRDLSALLGATASPPLRPEPIEVFATVVDPSSPLVARGDVEFPVVDEVVLLSPTADDVVPLLTSSIGFVHHLVACTRSVGRGRVVASALGATDRALESSELVRILRRTLAPAGRAARGRPFGIGVVGYGPHGGMGEAHGLAAGATAGLELVAAVDHDPSRQKAAEQAFPGVRTCADVTDLLTDVDVAVAVVATPPSSHAALGLQLLRAGKHVVLEKPMCLTVAEADQLITTATASGLMLTVHQNRRWDPDFLALRRAIGAGLVGDVFNVETFVGGFEHPCRAWHSEDSISGGAVYDWGSHHVDWILQLMGSMPARVSTTAHKRVWHDTTNHDQLRLRLVWADGREAEFLQSDIAAVRRPKLWVQGTGGTIVGHYRPLVTERLEPGRGYVRDESHHAEAPVPLTLARYESGYGLTETMLPPVPEQRFAFHRNIADHLHLGEALAVSAPSVRAVVAVLEASHRSGLDGATVELEGSGEPVGP